MAVCLEILLFEKFLRDLLWGFFFSTLFWKLLRQLQLSFKDSSGIFFFKNPSRKPLKYTAFFFQKFFSNISKIFPEILLEIPVIQEIAPWIPSKILLGIYSRILSGSLQNPRKFLPKLILVFFFENLPENPLKIPVTPGIPLRLLTKILSGIISRTLTESLQNPREFLQILL